jgi:phage shock protein PspC (stress-responsive transcriptional regulator)
MEKRLYRSRDNRMVFGVCGGIGEYTGIDPTVIRLGMIFIGLTCVGLLFYIAAGLIIPERPLYPNVKKTPDEDRFDPLAGAKPETEFKTETKTEAKTEAYAEPEVEPVSPSNPKTVYEALYDEALEVSDESAPVRIMDDETETREV